MKPARESRQRTALNRWKAFVLIEIHPAHTPAAHIASAHPGAAIAGRLSGSLRPGSMGGKRRVLCRQMLLPASRAL
jgi:hypothetical protein